MPHREGKQMAKRFNASYPVWTSMDNNALVCAVRSDGKSW
jgi:hypothetical protein